MEENRFEMFTISMARIWRSIQRLKADAMEPFGLRGTHVMCLFFLRHSEEGLTASEISDVSELDKGAVSRAVAELIKLGYIQCQPADGKRKYRTKMTLTEAGLKVSQRMNRAIEEAVRGAGQGMTDEEREIFYRSLNLIATNLQTLTVEIGQTEA